MTDTLQPIKLDSSDKLSEADKPKAKLDQPNLPLGELTSSPSKDELKSLPEPTEESEQKLLAESEEDYVKPPTLEERVKLLELRMKEVRSTCASLAGHPHPLD